MERREVGNGWIYFDPNFIKQEDQRLIFSRLMQESRWSGGEIVLFGKKFEIPRKQLYMADSGMEYSYSGKILEIEKWSPLVAELKARVEIVAGQTFNACLLNLYRNGRDSNGWHADNERELGKNPLIASLSFGASRYFDLKHIFSGEKLRFDLMPGSLLIMGGELQHYWKHQIPKQLKIQEPRINLTFRSIHSAPPQMSLHQ